MLEIHYSADGSWDDGIKKYERASDFVSEMYLEVPPFQDYYVVTKAVLDGQELDLPDSTIGGLFNYLAERTDS